MFIVFVIIYTYPKGPHNLGIFCILASRNVRFITDNFTSTKFIISIVFHYFLTRYLNVIVWLNGLLFCFYQNVSMTIYSFLFSINIKHVHYNSSKMFLNVLSIKLSGSIECGKWWHLYQNTIMIYKRTPKH